MSLTDTLSPTHQAGHAPVLVLMPGLDGSGELFAPLSACIPVQLPQFKLRYPQQTGWHWQDYPDYAYQQLAGQQQVVLIAESFSGPIAIQLAGLLGTRCRALILVASFVSCPHPLLSLCRALLAHAPFKLIPVSLAYPLLFSGAEPDLRKRFDAVWRSLPNALIARRLRLIAELNPEQTHQQITALNLPVFYLQAQQDKLVSKQALKQIQQACTELTAHQLAGPHGILQARAAACWDVIQYCLQSLNHR